MSCNFGGIQRKDMKKTIILSIAIALLSSTIAFSQEIVVENGKAYKLHTVEKGEGFYRLSINHNTTQEAIISANPQLKETGLVVGSVIKIPLKEMKTPTTESVFTTHVVQKGETAYSISNKYGMKLSDFYAMNPGSETSLSEGRAVKVKGTGTEYSQRYVTHTIAQGETLYSIGVKYGVKAGEIAACNPSLDITALPIGTEIRIPQTTIPTEDSNYYYHRIAKGETLYSLCIKYDVLQEKIIGANEGIDWQKLSIGQVVAVPKKNVEPKFTEHLVKKKETLYSITRQYDITQEELQAWNPSIDVTNLQKDMTLRIMDKSSLADIAPATTNPIFVGTGDLTTFDETYNYRHEGSPTIRVALMLPFDAQNELYRRRNSTEENVNNQPYYFKSRRYIEFYEGVKMAIDTLASMGGNIDLTVYDANTTLSVANVLSSTEAQQFDLIIGPAQLDRMKLVSDFAQTNHIPAVFPFAQLDSSLNENPYAIQASTVDTLVESTIIETMLAQCTGKRVIMMNIDSKSTLETWRNQRIRTACNERNVELIELKYNTSAFWPFLDTLSIERENVIVIPTTNEAKVNSIIVSVASVMDQKPEAKVTLLGYGEWLAFSTIEVEVFHKLNTMIVSTFGLDYSDAKTQKILQRYRLRHNAEPVAFTPYFQRLKQGSGYSEYALWGYDVALQFVGARIALGPDFVRHLNDYKPELVQTNFIFRNVTNWGGAANVGLKAITFTKQNTVEVHNAN